MQGLATRFGFQRKTIFLLLHILKYSKYICSLVYNINFIENIAVIFNISMVPKKNACLFFRHNIATFYFCSIGSIHDSPGPGEYLGLLLKLSSSESSSSVTSSTQTVKLLLFSTL